MNTALLDTRKKVLNMSEPFRAKPCKSNHNARINGCFLHYHHEDVERERAETQAHLQQYDRMLDAAMQALGKSVARVRETDGKRGEWAQKIEKIYEKSDNWHLWKYRKELKALAGEIRGE